MRAAQRQDAVARRRRFKRRPRVGHLRLEVRAEKPVEVVFHKIAPYAAVERERFLERRWEEDFSEAVLSRIAGIVVTAACDLSRVGALQKAWRFLANRRPEAYRGIAD